MAEIKKLPLTSMDIKEHQLTKFKELFPEVFSEGNKVDWDKLRLSLGEEVDTGKERYGMNWPGKAECFKIIQQPSIATLVPDREESIDFDTTQNLFIEGDNLEVLKLLQKSYLGKVKMIYIDPPYNTGNDFIYPDNYSESLDTYLSYTGQVDSEGRKFNTNTETDGRFHSKWMNMMYPRLFLAKNLLREDGVIFISIDDNEVDNLKKICCEIFGEENFFAQVIIQSNKRGQTYKQISKTHEYLLVYTKYFDTEFNELEKTGDKDDLDFEDNLGRFNIRELRNRNPKFGRFNRPNLYYPFYVNQEIKDKDGYNPVSLEKSNLFNIEVYPLNSSGEESCWRWGENLAQKNIADNTLGSNLVAKIKGNGDFNIYEKYRKTTYKPKSIWEEVEVITERGTIELGELKLSKYFDFPKPKHLIKKALMIGTNEEDIILDFFAGSCTTAHAIFEQNKEDGTNRKFILVQLPEPCTENSEAYKTGYKTIADIGKERIRRVIKKIKKEHAENTDMFKHDISKLDLGFKVYKLAKSNFNIWDASIEKTPEAIQQKLFEHIKHISPEAEQEAILYELLLKSGFELTTPIDKLTIEGKTVFSIAEGQLLICLEKELTHEVIKAMAEKQPSRVICLDEGFQNNDQLKTNAVQIMKSKGVLNFRTV